MNAGAPGAGPLTVAFADPDSGTWGIAWGAEQPILALALDGGQPLVAGAEIEAGGASAPWRISTEDGELSVTAAGPSADEPDGALAGFDQLCRVHGRIAERELDCLGRLGARREPIDPRKFQSLQDVSAWFSADDGVALVSARPRKAQGHGADLLTASVFERGEARPVSDPRLSATYTADGRPLRIGLELWLDEPVEDDEEGPRQYPRRVAGEVVGGGASAAVGELKLEAALLRCHSRGLEGAGVFLLVAPR
jgi:hypothetical protein